MSKIDDMLLAKQVACNKNKDKVVLMNLATKKGFTSRIFPIVWNFNTKEDLRFYLWCCELHKWIKEVHPYVMTEYHRDNIEVNYLNTTLTYCLNQIKD